MNQQRLARFRAATRNIRTSTTIALWTSFIVSAALLIASFLVPPMGEIDPSVLKAASLVFAFAGLFFLREAVMEGLGVKLTHGQTIIEVHDLDGHPVPGTPAPDPDGEIEAVIESDSDTE